MMAGAQRLDAIAWWPSGVCMGVLVKYVVEDDGGNIIRSSYLPQGYEDDDAAAVHIECSAARVM